MPRKTTDDKLTELNDTYHESDEKKISFTIKTALVDRNNRVVAKAAEICEEKLLYKQESNLLTAYQRLLKNAVKADAHCTGKNAILRALVALDFNDVAFYQASLAYKQMEPVWGGSVDTAIDIRNSAAMGIISTSYSRALIELVDLLNDKEPSARIGAVRAIAYGNPYEAALLLRQKIATDDDEAEVIGECMIALLHVEPDHSLNLITAYLKNQDNEVLYELAALALGDSRTDDALKALKSAWEQTFAYQYTLRRILLRAISLHRSDAAFTWLLALIESADKVVISEIIELLAIYKHNKTLKKKLFTLLDKHSNREHMALLREHWG